ncbi:MAG TPA: O-acetyl-ADP-ribose deacetylase [Povalibacter sp.]|nr:O-acetyl-ADP-ribose deacetylase [Povalibacter sp.]
MSREFLSGRVIVSVGDITTLAVDAIVNAANSMLLGGGGVDGAIHRAGGPAILAACREIRRTQYPSGLPAGEAVITTGGNLSARFVIHTVGPVWDRDPEPAQLLGSCYHKSIALALREGLSEIAFPSIATGAFGYPKHLAAAVASQAIGDALSQQSALQRVHLVFFSPADAALFARHQKFPAL